MSGLMDMLGRRGAGTLLRTEDLRDGPRQAMQAAIRARCQAVPLDQRTILCRVLGRYKMLVDARDLGLGPHLLLDGYWEYWCTSFMLNRIRPGQVCLDVGANLGYYAVLMADLSGPTGRVLALEPNPRLATLCARSLALNGFAARSAVHRLAASDAPGTLRFRASDDDPKNGHVLDGLAEEAEDGALEVAVRAAPLDDLVEGAADFIKVDVEGAEEKVWAGMQRLLDRSPGVAVLMEFNAFRCQAPEQTLRAIADRFPLRELRLDGAVAPVEPAAILDRTEDTLLVLARAG
ncbi:FkbM family methyltransferase [Falsiroseomonas sp. HW251]|uniref:FkbM family methyltransferase n=1 Tax=Falsiroseomonas sp. HW251 TaxID=3390998 RepID=UPI003D315116